MKVLHVLQNSLPSLAGYCIRADGLMRALQSRGVQIVALTGAAERAGREPVEEISGVRYYRTRGHVPAGPAGYREWVLMRALLQRLEEVAAIETPDLIHVHSPAYNALAAMTVARRRGIPWVYEIRALWEDAAVDRRRFTTASPIYKAAAALETFVCRRAHAVVTICEGLRKEVLSRGIDASKVFVAMNGVDPQSFGPLDKDHGLARELGVDGFPVFAFIGSLFAYEGVEELVDGFPRLVDAHPDARLLVLGGGEREPQVRARIDALGLPQIVFRARVPHAEVGRYYSIADCLVYPRRSNRLTETVTPLKPLEAMAMQKTVIASDVGGHRELIDHDVTGLLYRAGDASALTAALRRIAAEPGLGATLASAGRMDVIARRTWQATTAGHIDAYAHAERSPSRYGTQQRRASVDYN